MTATSSERSGPQPNGLTRFSSYYSYGWLHGELAWHAPAERYDGTPFTVRGFERIPALERLQTWLLLEVVPA